MPAGREPRARPRRPWRGASGSGGLRVVHWAPSLQRLRPIPPAPEASACPVFPSRSRDRGTGLPCSASSSAWSPPPAACPPELPDPRTAARRPHRRAPSPAPSASASSPGASDASPGPSPSPSAPLGDFTGGTAKATLALPAGAVAYAGGTCEDGPGNAWVAVNIGQPNGAEYFGLIAGRSPYGASDLQTAAGGGTFKGDAVLVTYRHAGKTYRARPRHRVGPPVRGRLGRHAYGAPGRRHERERHLPLLLARAPRVAGPPGVTRRRSAAGQASARTSASRRARNARSVSLPARSTARR